MSFTHSVQLSYFLMAPVLTGLGSYTDASRNLNVKVSVFPEWYKGASLQWIIPSAWGNCSFHVYFSEGEGASFRRLTSTPLSSPHFKDPSNRDYSKFQTGSYVVEVLLPGGNSVRSLPTSWHYNRRDKIDRMASEIQRREYLLLSKFAGVKSYFFKKRSYGLRCSRCWNPNSEKVMDDHCPVCLGTSWEGGYFQPVPSYIQFEPTPNSKIKSYVGDLEPNSIGAWTISFPEVSPGDVIIRTGDFNAYIATSVSQTELQSKPVRQTLTLTQLSRNDIENSLTSRIESTDSSDYLNDFPTRFTKERFPINVSDTNRSNDPMWNRDQNLSILPKYSL